MADKYCSTSPGFWGRKCKAGISDGSWGQRARSKAHHALLPPVTSLHSLVSFFTAPSTACLWEPPSTSTRSRHCTSTCQDQERLRVGHELGLKVPWPSQPIQGLCQAHQNRNSPPLGPSHSTPARPSSVHPPHLDCPIITSDHASVSLTNICLAPPMSQRMKTHGEQDRYSPCFHVPYSPEEKKDIKQINTLMNI